LNTVCLGMCWRLTLIFLHPPHLKMSRTASFPLEPFFSQETRAFPGIAHLSPKWLKCGKDYLSPVVSPPVTQSHLRFFFALSEQHTFFGTHEAGGSVKAWTEPLSRGDSPEKAQVAPTVHVRGPENVGQPNDRNWSNLLDFC